MIIDKALEDIVHFSGGIFDTSSLIYLSKIGLLHRVAQVFSVLVIPQVQAEFKQKLPENVISIQAPEGGADTVIIEVAQRENCTVISEDKQVLMKARKAGLVYFNALMVIFALLHHGHITTEESRVLCTQLDEHARYGVAVREFGKQVLERLVLK